MDNSRKREGMTILEAIHDGMDMDFEPKKDSWKNDSKFADLNLKHCTSCKLVWELEYECGKHRQLSYSHIPKVGKGECKCPQCRLNDREKTYVAWYRGESSVILMSRFDSGIKKRYVRPEEDE